MPCADFSEEHGKDFEALFDKEDALDDPALPDEEVGSSRSSRQLHPPWVLGCMLLHREDLHASCQDPIPCHPTLVARFKPGFHTRPGFQPA